MTWERGERPTKSDNTGGVVQWDKTSTGGTGERDGGPVSRLSLGSYRFPWLMFTLVVPFLCMKSLVPDTVVCGRFWSLLPLLPKPHRGWDPLLVVGSGPVT